MPGQNHSADGNGPYLMIDADPSDLKLFHYPLEQLDVLLCAPLPLRSSKQRCANLCTELRPVDLPAGKQPFERCSPRLVWKPSVVAGDL